MLYRIRETGEVQTQDQIKAEHPNTSLPLVWDSSVCDTLGIDPVLNGPQPTPTFYQYVVQDGIEEINGQWFTKFICVDMDQEQKDAKDAEYKTNNKATAEQLLQETDWTQMPDVDLLNKQAFTDYRAAVRTIVLNPPIIVENWPVKPEEQWNI